MHLVAMKPRPWCAYLRRRPAQGFRRRTPRSRSNASLVSVAELGFSGFYPLLAALRRDLEAGRLAAPAALSRADEPNVRQAADLVAGTFLFDPASRRLEWQGAEPPGGVRAWLRDRLLAASRAPGEGPFATLHQAIGGQLHSFVFEPERPGEGTRLLGFEAAGGAFMPRFRRALERGPLFPQSLLHGALSNDVLFVQLLDPLGRELFRAGHPREPYLGVSRPFGKDYNRILDGFVLRASVDPAAAPSLVIGGLPRSRLPVLLALLLLAAGLSVTALLQVRREQALSVLRSDFVSRVSHELRTPLTQIRMFTETLLLERVRSPAERQRCLEIIDRESQRLTHLVENILRFSRSERGGDHLEVRSSDIVPLVRQTAHDFEPLVGAGSRLSIELPPRAIAEVDESALQQILLNLLDNAVKYGPERQEVRLQLRAEGEAVRLAVEDQGPGIPAEQRDLVWQRFYRLPQHRQSAIAGTGIGLAVVHDLVGRLGGRVLVEDGEHQGARFVVLLRSGEGDRA